MLEIPAYTLVEEGTDRLWSDFKKMVRDLEWTSTDNTVLWAIPQLKSTRCVFAKKDEDGTMLGCCVWNELDGMAWIGFYMTLPSLQGAGLGSKIWTKALERIREKKQVIGLRAVSAMREKYSAGATPVEVSHIKKNLLTVDQMKEFIARYDHPDRRLELYYEMHDDQREDLLRLDREVTGRDRSEWLGKLCSSEESEVAVLFDDDGKVCAYSAISTVGHLEMNMFKIGPCYASSVAEFAAMAKWLVQWAEKYPPGARIIVGILTGSAGDRELAEVLGHRIPDELVTLFSEEVETKMNLDKCYVPNNARCHYDA